MKRLATVIPYPFWILAIIALGLSAIVAWIAWGRSGDDALGSMPFLSRAYAETTGVSSWRKDSLQEMRSTSPEGFVRTRWNEIRLEESAAGAARLVMRSWMTQKDGPSDQERVLRSPPCDVEERIFIDNQEYFREYYRCGEGPWEVTDVEIPPEYQDRDRGFTLQGLEAFPGALVDVKELPEEQIDGVLMRVFQGSIPPEETGWYSGNREQRAAFLETAKVTVTLWVGKEDLYFRRYVTRTEFQKAASIGGDSVVDISQTDFYDFNAAINIEPPL